MDCEHSFCFVHGLGAGDSNSNVLSRLLESNTWLDVIFIYPQSL